MEDFGYHLEMCKDRRATWTATAGALNISIYRDRFRAKPKDEQRTGQSTERANGADNE